MGMDIKEALKYAPQHIQESPLVQAMVQLIQGQTEQIQRQAEQIQQLKKTVNELKDEIARLNKKPKRPKLRPNGMEPRNRGKPGRGSQNSTDRNTSLGNKKLEEVRIPAEGVPEGSRFKGYQEFTVQDVELSAKETTYKLEVWQTPDGAIVRSKLPDEISGHFAPTLKATILNLYAHGMTHPSILDFLHGIGIEISSGQLNNILLNEAEAFAQAGEEILSAGLSSASYIRTDDTGERHKKTDGYCTQIGGEYFAYYKTAYSKSRENFLDLLCQGKRRYYVNEAMIHHLFRCGVEDDVLNLFEGYRGKRYLEKKGLSRLFNTLGLVSKQLRKQCLEAGLVGFISEEILKPHQVLLSDRAGQFCIFDHADCWAHVERPLRSIVPTSPQVEEELTTVRNAIWTLYRLVAEASLTQSNREEVYRLYDALVEMKSISPEIMSVIEVFRNRRFDLLKALDHPGLPLHNNDSERDIRRVVKRRVISGGTKSELGRKFRDGLATLKQTCFRLGQSFWDFSLEWFRGQPPDLAEIVRLRYQAVKPSLP